MPAQLGANSLAKSKHVHGAIPSIAVNDDDPATPSLPPLNKEEIAGAAVFLRILQELPSRRQKRQERAQTNLSLAQNKHEFQEIWKNEIRDHLVNHPRSSLRALFKREHKTTSTGQRRGSKPGPHSIPRSIQEVGRIEGFQIVQNVVNMQEEANSDRQAVPPEWEADKPQLEDVFRRPRIWKSWQYQCSHPRLAKFLSAANHPERSRCEVSVKDFPYDEEENPLDQWNSTSEREKNYLKDRPTNQRDIGEKNRQTLILRRQTILDHEKLWEHIRSRFKVKGQNTYVLGRRDSSYMIPCRILQVVDLSPNCATLLLESSPRMDLSYVATFLERHLSNSSWATANLITNTGNNSKLRNYLLEYHISFYHVTSRRTNIDQGYNDDRLVRQVSPFTAGPKAKARRIYEEQLSFITIGHGGDVYTNIQLAEKYSCDSEDDLYESPFYMRPRKKRVDSSLEEHQDDDPRGVAFFVSRLKPCSAFLAWIANSMRHVVARWATAISAVDAEVESSFQATFHGDKHSLLSDDSSFSRSKKYVWAIQVYRVFEKKLEQTIKAWKDFEKNSLEKLDQEQLASHKEESLAIIHAAIEALQLKRDNVRSRRQEVSDMKDGLFATSQLLDSRVTVRQNDNIRLLTYVNLLFLPLAFCTSIFGMQTILPNRVHGGFFAITICIVTVFTVFMVFNLQLMSEVVEGVIGKGTKWLRKLMGAHHRAHWHKTGQALQTSREAANIIVQNRLRRTSHWMYFVFLIEVVLVMIPVREIEAARKLWGLRRHLNNPTRDVAGPHITGVPARLKRARETSAIMLAALVLRSMCRAMLLPLWLLMVGIEVLVVSTYLLLVFATHEGRNLFKSKKSDGNTMAPSKKRRSHPFRIPLQLLGFCRESEKRLPESIQRKMKRWRTLIAESQGTALSPDPNTLENGQQYYMSRSEIAFEENRLKQAASSASRGPSLGIPFESRGRRKSESSIVRLERSISPGRPSPVRARTMSMRFDNPFPMVAVTA